MEKNIKIIGQEVLQKESQAIAKVQLTDSFVDAVNMIINRSGDLIVLGVGKSGHIAKKVAASLTSMGIKSLFIHPTEAGHGDLGSISEEDVCLIFSHSGNTGEIVVLIPYIRAKKIAITSNPDSNIGKDSDIVIETNVTEEISSLDAPTTSSTVSLAIGDALAVSIAEVIGFSRKHFALNHPLGSLGRKMTAVKQLMKPKDEIAIGSMDTPIIDILYSITQHKTGQAFITENDILVGIITDGDIRRALLESKEVLDKQSKDIMKKDPLFVTQDMLMAEAEQKMRENNVTCLAVVSENNKLVGSITQGETI